MADFNKAIVLTLAQEGGFNRNLGDGEGMTYRGLTQKSDPDWGGWAYLKSYIQKNGYPKEESILPELEDSVKVYYKQKYWGLVRGDEIMSQDIANFGFDFTVHSGRARKEINIAINNAAGSDVVPTDNVITNDTLNYLNNNADLVYPYIVEQRKTYLSGLHGFVEFGKDWLNRVASFPAVIAGAITTDEQKKN